MKKIVALLAIGLSINAFSQTTNLDELQPGEEYDNIYVKKMFSDSLCTSFIIWIKKEVKAHKHEHHSETIYVLEGKGTMTVGKDTFEIRKGDFFNIPMNTAHNLKVTSTEAVKVISVQAPLFDGSDRIFIK